MTSEASHRIAALIDRIKTAADSADNRRRGRRCPCVSFGLEEPIAWTIIFGFDANRYFSDPEFYFEQRLREKLWRWENFPDDDTPLSAEVPAWLGYYPEYTFFDMDVNVEPGGVPQLQTDHPLTRQPDMKLLKPIDFKTSGWMPRILRWYDDLEKISAGRCEVTFNMTWTRGCLDLAIQLRGYDNFIVDTVERPGFVHDLLKFLVEQRCRWWDGYYRHFGLKRQPVLIADDWINVPFITPAMFADFVLPRYLEIEAFHGGLTGIHSCGNQTPVQKHLLKVKSLAALEVSPWTDLRQTLENVPAEKSLGVVLHPNDVLCANSEEMENKLGFIVESCGQRPYSIGTSGLTPLSDDIGAFIARINTWLGVVAKVMGPVWDSRRV